MFDRQDYDPEYLVSAYHCNVGSAITTAKIKICMDASGCAVRDTYGKLLKDRQIIEEKEREEKEREEEDDDETPLFRLRRRIDFNQDSESETEEKENVSPISRYSMRNINTAPRGSERQTRRRRS